MDSIIFLKEIQITVAIFSFHTTFPEKVGPWFLQRNRKLVEELDAWFFHHAGSEND